MSKWFKKDATQYALSKLEIPRQRWIVLVGKMGVDRGDVQLLLERDGSC